MAQRGPDQGALFESPSRAADAPRPLADRLRPQSLDDVVGQPHILGPEGTLTALLNARHLGSLILWGPPGSGKTTIARLLADSSNLEFVQMSAIFSGVQDLRKAFDAARLSRDAGRGTMLFVDEIHRFNRAQQDGFLPVMEDGTVTLVGATTENPSFELNAALLSRAAVLHLKPLDEAALEALLARAEAEMGRGLPVDAEGRAALIAMADGDGRHVLNLAETLFEVAGPEAEGVLFDRASLARIVQQRAPVYDRDRDGHYNLISALHKSVRGSDPQAALYWLARMLAGGENPLFIARRMVRMAVEDIGLADPQALVQANAAKEAYEFLGSPEGELALAQACVYLAAAPKSNALYTGFKKAAKQAKSTGSAAPPAIILNAPTKLMKDEGYGAGYIYDHDTEQGFSGQNYFPDKVRRQDFYRPVSRGFEREIAKRLDYWDGLRNKQNDKSAKE
ncbi:MAG: AAA family ATPase [Hyphomicrobiales bacterium]|nr:MAG: AAA family ATPase [Hyphomicrobiales bacterium]